MLHLAQNIKLIRLIADMTQTNFGQKFHATKAMIISYEKGKASPDELFIKRLSDFARVSVNDLQNKELSEADIKVEKEENVDNGSEPEASFLEKRRKLKNTHSIATAPLIPAKAQAGYVRAIDQEQYMNTLEQYALPPGIDPRGAHWAYWEVSGDSMEPTFRSGDIILTSQVHAMDWENIRNFYVYVVVTNEMVVVKRLYAKNSAEWVLISENEDNYPQQLIATDTIKQLWVFRRKLEAYAPPTKQFKISV